MRRSYLFLDVDGVLNHLVWDRRMWHHLGRTLREPYEKVDPECMSRLNRICAWTGCYVVISSSWRVGRTVEELVNLFRELGFTGDIAGMTGGGQDRNRGRQILDWLYQVNEDDATYVVLEDEPSDMEDIIGNVIHVNNRVGLTDNDMQQAILRLGGSEPQEPVRYRLTRGTSFNEDGILKAGAILEVLSPDRALVLNPTYWERKPHSKPPVVFWGPSRFGGRVEVFLGDVGHREPMRYLVTKPIVLGGELGILRPRAIVEPILKGKLKGKAFVRNLEKWDIEHPERQGPIPWDPFDPEGVLEGKLERYTGPEPGLV